MCHNFRMTHIVETEYIKFLGPYSTVLSSVLSSHSSPADSYDKLPPDLGSITL